MKSIPVFVASNDNYAPFVATAIYSILANTDSFVDFYILDGGIKKGTKKKINNSLSEFKNYSIEYIDMKPFTLRRFPSIKHYSTVAFARYFIPEVKPNLGKVLYLDADIIVKDDIAKLYDQDLQGFPLGAVLEDFYPGNYTKLKEEIYPEYKGGSNYFNSGVLIIQTSYFRKNNITKDLIGLTIKLAGKLSCADQDVYNIVFENNFKILDYKFNYMPDHFNYLKKLHPEKAEGIRDGAVILHYTAGKPWYDKSIASKDFWDIANKTEFSSFIKDNFLGKVKYSNAKKKKIKFLGITFLKIKKTDKNKKVYLFGFIKIYEKKVVN